MWRRSCNVSTITSRRQQERRERRSNRDRGVSADDVHHSNSTKKNARGNMQKSGLKMWRFFSFIGLIEEKFFSPKYFFEHFPHQNFFPIIHSPRYTTS